MVSVTDAYILGIESSCDETAAAVVRSGEELISNVVYSQFATHQPYGGVVPELASREHLRAIVPVVRKALDDAGQTYETIDAIAVTKGPGLAGALLVGLSYAKALAYAVEKPLIGVNHLEGHIHAVLLEERQKGNRELEFPVLALVVSGGHTHLYLAEQQARMAGCTTMWDTPAMTRPARPSTRSPSCWSSAIRAARSSTSWRSMAIPQAVKFPFAQIKHRDRNPQNRHADDERACRLFLQRNQDRSPALRGNARHARAASSSVGSALAEMAKPSREDYLAACDQQTLDLVASFQRAVVNDLVSKTLLAAREHNVATLLVTGGVAANSELRTSFEQRAAEEGVPVYFPSRKLSTDNAAMIAAAAYPRFLAGEFADAGIRQRCDAGALRVDRLKIRAATATVSCTL